MRFHPTIVPKPNAMATITLTHSGMYLVESSMSFLKTLRLVLVSMSKLTTLFFSKRPITSEVKYMSLRTLATAAIGTLAKLPYFLTCSPISPIISASPDITWG